jgi:Transcription factor zinc-finger
MIYLKTREFIANSVYYIMSEMPNCCPICQTRLDIIETVTIDSEDIQVNYCDKCSGEVLMVEDDVESWKD